jgi:hypothetical protein
MAFNCTLVAESPTVSTREPAQRFASISKTVPGERTDVLSRDALLPMAEGTEVHLMCSTVNDAHLVSARDEDLPSHATLWSGFCVDPNLSEIVFSVACDTAIDEVLNVALRFDRVLVNEGEAWNEKTNAFIAPTDGIYVFSFGVAVCDSAVGELDMIITSYLDKPTKNMYIVTQWNANSRGEVTISRSIVVGMNKRDEADIIKYGSLCVDAARPLTLLGFQYSPSGKTSFVAWAVYMHVELPDFGYWEFSFSQRKFSDSVQSYLSQHKECMEQSH